MLRVFVENWHLMRAIRLAIGVMVLVQAWEMGEWVLGGMGVWLTARAAFNEGCCGGQACMRPFSPAKGESRDGLA